MKNMIKFTRYLKRLIGDCVRRHTRLKRTEFELMSCVIRYLQQHTS